MQPPGLTQMFFTTKYNEVQFDLKQVVVSEGFS